MNCTMSLWQWAAVNTVSGRRASIMLASDTVPSHSSDECRLLEAMGEEGPTPAVGVWEVAARVTASKCQCCYTLLWHRG